MAQALLLQMFLKRLAIFNTAGGAWRQRHGTCPLYLWVFTAQHKSCQKAACCVKICIAIKWWKLFLQGRLNQPYISGGSEGFTPNLSWCKAPNLPLSNDREGKWTNSSSRHKILKHHDERTEANSPSTMHKSNFISRTFLPDLLCDSEKSEAHGLHSDSYEDITAFCVHGNELYKLIEETQQRSLQQETCEHSEERCRPGHW